MLAEDVLKLIDAGFSADEIRKMGNEPPATEPPATEPPATEPPATEPPATEPPANGGNKLDEVWEFMKAMQQKAIQQSEQPKGESADDILKFMIGGK